MPHRLLASHAPEEMEGMPKLIDLIESGQLFCHFDHSAWHLETRDG